MKEDFSDISKRKPVVETVGTYKEKKKRLTKKTNVDLPAKAIDAVTADHAKKNKNKGLAEAVRKRQGKPNIKGTMPLSMNDAFRKMPETVRKVPEFQRKFKEEILNVPMTGLTSRENYAKLIAERERLFKSARKQNIEDEWMRLNTETGSRAKTQQEQDRIAYLEAKYHDFDQDLTKLTKIPRPAGYVDHEKEAEAERVGQAVASALRAQMRRVGKGEGKGAASGSGGPG